MVMIKRLTDTEHVHEFTIEITLDKVSLDKFTWPKQPQKGDISTVTEKETHKQLQVKISDCSYRVIPYKHTTALGKEEHILMKCSYEKKIGYIKTKLTTCEVSRPRNTPLWR